MDFSRLIKPLAGETDWPTWKRKVLDYYEGATEAIDGSFSERCLVDFGTFGFGLFSVQSKNQNSEFASTPTESRLKVNSDVALYGFYSVNGSLFKANIEPILPIKMTEVHPVAVCSSLLQLYHER
ncbi:hypothetical protein TNIN_294871 [Trichonephila inaurata madagascariensis]|uniref:Uncharacterized protein n=1 Tax=Trichonephila inaurata madagascariensis TaxID=2747483 RepID=A0A8X7BQI8_9ARAC|nr:hypothetical protein TNIN_294871 [Trichonephila inaurata madagascariensis]